MKFIKVHSLAGWKPIHAGEVKTFKPGNKGRAVKLTITSTDYVDVFAKTANVEEVLIASERGTFSLEVHISEITDLAFVTGEDALIFAKGTAADHRVKATEGVESFTNVEPRSRRNSDVDRMMHFMKINDLRRQQELEGERQERRELRQELKEIRRQERKQSKQDEVIDNENGSQQTDTKVSPQGVQKPVQGEEANGTKSTDGGNKGAADASGGGSKSG